MIINKNENFFIQWDIVYTENNPLLGIFNFWINDRCYPGYAINITMFPIFDDLTSNISLIKNLKRNIGGIDIQAIDFNNMMNSKLVFLDVGELSQYGLSLIIGFDGSEERIFYSKDYGKSYLEVSLPKGTMLSTLEELAIQKEKFFSFSKVMV